MLSLMLGDAVKRRWHFDLASHPETHGWVLNLYRAGERYPETVSDYFPVEWAPWPELAADMRLHRGDEHRHVTLYSRALAALGQPVVELSGQDVFNRVIRDHTPASWATPPESETDGKDERRRRLAHFLMHAHHLEKRVQRSLEYHLEACARLGRPEVLCAVEKVHSDEERHVRYTQAACRELLCNTEYDNVLQMHARAEQAADRAFSARQVRAFLQRFGGCVKWSHRVLYAGCALLLDARS
jgi:hypothetical protein